MDYKKDKDMVVDTNPENLDPITKEPGSHPVGTGVGSAGGAATGAIVGGAVGGPVGAAVGGAIGAVVGGAAGHAAGEAVNPTVEAEYWRKNFKNRPYYRSGKEYSEYEPAYRYGWESAGREEYAGKKFAEVEPELERNWNSTEGSAGPWSDSREITRDAWRRVRGN